MKLSEYLKCVNTIFLLPKHRVTVKLIISIYIINTMNIISGSWVKQCVLIYVDKSGPRPKKQRMAWQFMIAFIERK